VPGCRREQTKNAGEKNAAEAALKIGDILR
jgi:hypothetical protein